MLNLSDKDIGLSLAAVIRDPDFVTFLRSDKFETLRTALTGAQRPNFRGTTL